MALLTSNHVTQSLVSLICIYICYYFFIVVQRLLLHPLRKFPGPWVAAVTGWYETYHEAVLGGTFVKQYSKWHKRYGGTRPTKADGQERLTTQKDPLFKYHRTIYTSASWTSTMSLSLNRAILHKLYLPVNTGYLIYRALSSKIPISIEIWGRKSLCRRYVVL